MRHAADDSHLVAMQLTGLPGIGGLFELVSCPHYLAEIIIYIGLLGMMGPQRLLPWLILLWLVRLFCVCAAAIARPPDKL